MTWNKKLSRVMVENPRGHQVGRMGKAKVKMMMMICTWKLHKSSLDHVTWAPKLGSPVATATMVSSRPRNGSRLLLIAVGASISGNR